MKANNSTTPRNRIDATISSVLTMLAYISPVSGSMAVLATIIVWRMMTTLTAVFWAVWPMMALLAYIIITRSIFLALVDLATVVGLLDGVSDTRGSEFVQTGKNQFRRRDALIMRNGDD